MRAYTQDGLNIIKVLPKPRNKFYAFMELKFLIVLFLLSLVLYFFEGYIPNDNNFISGVFLGIPFLIYIVYVRVGNFFRRENKKYKVVGKMCFYENFIEINNVKKYLIEIEEIKIDNYDFKGNLIVGYQLTKPLFSLGIDNFFTIYYKNGTVQKVQFKQEKECHLSYFKKELMNYYHYGIIDIHTINRILI